MRRLRAPAALAFTTLLWGVSTAGLPDWAAEIEARVPDLPAVDETGPEFLVLLDETAVDVRPDGRLGVRQRLAAVALRERVDGFRIGHYVFDEDTEFTSSRAWHRAPGGKARRVRAPAFEFSLGGSFLTDAATRVVPIEQARRGSLIFVEFEAIERPPTLTFARVVQGDDPIVTGRVELRVPERWRVLHDWPRGGGVEPRVEGTSHVWEFHDLPAIDGGEPLGIPARDRVPFIVTAIVPPPDAVPAGVGVVPDWSSFSVWYEELGARRYEATPAVRAKAGSLAGDDRIATIVAAARFVRDEVRYLAREVGIGGLRPRPAEQVLDELLGDCKDKGALFRALLAAEGVPSYPVLIAATRRDSVSQKVPSPGAFDHFVVAVPLPSDESVPDALRPALVVVDGFGPLLIVDTTDDRTSIGSLPAYLAGKTGLLVAGGAGRLLTLPDGDPSAHRVHRERTTRLVDVDTVRVEERTTSFGEPASLARSDWRLSPADFAARRETAVALRVPGADITDHDVEVETPGGEFVEAIGWVAPSNGRIGLYPDLLADLPRLRLERRAGPVVYPYSRTLRVSHRIEGLAADVALPDDGTIEGDGWRIEAWSERDGDVVTAVVELRLVRRRFDPDRFDELSRLWDEWRALSGHAAPI